LFVRLLGYDVRPFPDGKLGKLRYRIVRRLIRVAVKRGMLKRRREKNSRVQGEQEEQARQEVSV
jgi:hypothetical protein